ncbi:MAG: sensor histidine kinase [Solirubrobacteraceae bacterium]
MSLRARLLIGLVVLAAVGLIAAGLTTYAEQRSFLYARVDQQVAASQFLVGGQFGVLRGVAPRPVQQRRPPGPRPTTFQASATYGLLLAADGRVLEQKAFTYGTAAASPPALPARLPRSRLGSTRIRVLTVNSKSGSGLRYRVAAFTLDGGRTLVVAVPLREVDQTLHRLIVVEGLVGGGVILALVLVGWVVIRLGLLPLERIGRVAGEIARANQGDGDESQALSRRVVPANSRTEVGRLGLSLNEMLIQIEQAFADRRESEDRLRQFLADASHELRTPLASIRGYAEAFRLGAAAEPATLERAMARIEAEAARMGVLVEDLLLLASLDELPERRRAPVDLCELAEHAADDARAVAPKRRIRLTTDGPVQVIADADQLRQLLANLTRNALIHTPADSPIELGVRRERDRAVLEVRDHGPGLPGDAGDHLFERFWRAEGGRRRGRGGSGLGLAIVKAIVQAHHGQVHARNAANGGAIFTVRLPLADAGAGRVRERLSEEPAVGILSDDNRTAARG